MSIESPTLGELRSISEALGDFALDIVEAVIGCYGPYSELLLGKSLPVQTSVADL
jgi:hypothetical protein